MVAKALVENAAGQNVGQQRSAEQLGKAYLSKGILMCSVVAGLSPGDILAPALYHGYYIRPRINKQLDRGISEVTLNDHKFQVFLDVCHFTPDEISVRTVDNLLEVTAQHPQKADKHGFISREFTRTYILPLDVDPLLVKATLTHDGILCIEALRTGKEVKAKINEVKVTCQEQPVAEKGEKLEKKS